MESSQKEEGLSAEGSMEKCCSDCKTTKTPLWRSGPSGPKSLCNACGIRYRKKRPTGDTRNGEIGKKKKKMKKLRNALKVKMMGLRTQRQWGEVERAALLLMALSCGAVFS